MEDTTLPIKGSSVADKYKGIIKRKRPGRDKESRMKDLSDDESSGDSESTVDKEISSMIKNSKGQGTKTDRAKESTSDDSFKLKEKERISKHQSSDKHKKQKRSKDRRPRDSSESSLCSSDSSYEAKRESRQKEKKLKESIIKRMMAKMKDSPTSIKVSIERKKYETVSKVNEKKSSLDNESIVEVSLIPKPRDDPIEIESQVIVHKTKHTDKYGTSSRDVEKGNKSKPIICSSSNNSSSSEHGEISPRKKAMKEDQMQDLQTEVTKIPRIPDKLKEKKHTSNGKLQDHSQSQETLSDSSSSSSESVDADYHTQEQSKKKFSSSDKPNNQIEEESKIVRGNMPQTVTSLDIKNDRPSEKESEKEKSVSRSSSRSIDSPPKESKDITNVETKASVKVGKKADSRNKRERKFSRSSESSNSSSDSESSAPEATRRSRNKKRGRKLEKSVKKEKSHVKRIPSNRVKSNRKGHKNNRRGLSASSSSSSYDSSSSTSGSSSSGSSSRSSSVSKDRSSSSSSSTSSSSGRQRHKRSYKTKESAKHRSKSPMNVRRNSPPRPKKIHVGHLPKTINKFHLYEIFGLYGTVKNVDLPLDRTNGHTPRGFAYVEYKHACDAEKALKHMDGGDIDGQKITTAPVMLYKPRPMPLRRISPNRRPFMNWRYTPPFRNRGGGAMMSNGARDNRRRMRSPPHRRSPRRRTRSRSPIRRHRVRRRSLSSSH